MPIERLVVPYSLGLDDYKLMKFMSSNCDFRNWLTKITTLSTLNKVVC